MHKEWRPAEEITAVNLYPSSVVKRKKLRVVGRQAHERLTKEAVVDGVLHELQNCLQSIGMGVDLLQLSQPEALECRTINLGIERASRLLREMQEYFFPPEAYLSIRNLGEVLAEVIRGATRETGSADVRTHLPEALPSFQYDWLTLSRVLERVLRCARGLLPPQGGETIVSVAVQEEQTQTTVEIKVEICGAGELEIDEERVFTPFWRVNDYQAGLGLALARQAIQSRHGQLTFEKTHPCRAHFALLLEVLSESISFAKR